MFHNTPNMLVYCSHCACWLRINLQVQLWGVLRIAQQSRSNVGSLFATSMLAHGLLDGTKRSSRFGACQQFPLAPSQRCCWAAPQEARIGGPDGAVHNFEIKDRAHSSSTPRLRAPFERRSSNTWAEALRRQPQWSVAPGGQARR